MAETQVYKILSSLSYSCEKIPDQTTFIISPYGTTSYMSFLWKSWDSRPKIFVGKRKDKMVEWKTHYEWKLDEHHIDSFLRNTVESYLSAETADDSIRRDRENFKNLAQEYADDPLFLSIYRDCDFYHLRPPLLLTMMGHIIEDLSSDMMDEDIEFAKQISHLCHFSHPMTVLVEAARLDEGLFEEILRRLVISLEVEGIDFNPSFHEGGPLTDELQFE